MIGIVNYGLGNLGSIHNMLSYLGHSSVIIDCPSDLDKVSKIILPGVGAFDTGMNALIQNKWIDKLNEKVLIDKMPVLGICLGMQLMTNRSEEGTVAGLGWVKAITKKFKFDNISLNLKIPHMGWNTVLPVNQSVLQDELLHLDEIRYYFVHSYIVELEDENDSIYNCNYGGLFCAAFQHNNIFGVQFHPEKSHKFGFSLLNNFAKI